VKNIITIQHTQSIHHTNGMVGSWTDWDLTELGVKQAHAIGERLSAELQPGNLVMYASDLLRARYTAEIVGAYLGVEPILTNALREHNLGKAVGKSVQWLRENVECRGTSIDDRLFSDAESKRELWNRLLPFYEKILSDPQDTILVVSHGATLGIFHAMWLCLEPEALNKCTLFGPAGGVSFLQQDWDGKHLVKRLSDLSYVKG